MFIHRLVPQVPTPAATTTPPSNPTSPATPSDTQATTATTSTTSTTGTTPSLGPGTTGQSNEQMTNLMSHLMTMMSQGNIVCDRH